MKDLKAPAHIVEELNRFFADNIVAMKDRMNEKYLPIALQIINNPRRGTLGEKYLSNAGNTGPLIGQIFGTVFESVIFDVAEECDFPLDANNPEDTNGRDFADFWYKGYPFEVKATRAQFVTGSKHSNNKSRNFVWFYLDMENELISPTNLKLLLKPHLKQSGAIDRRDAELMKVFGTTDQTEIQDRQLAINNDDYRIKCIGCFFTYDANFTKSDGTSDGFSTFRLTDDNVDDVIIFSGGIDRMNMEWRSEVNQQRDLIGF